MDSDFYDFLELYDRDNQTNSLESPKLAPLELDEAPPQTTSALDQFDELISQIPKPIETFDSNGFPNFLKLDTNWSNHFFNDLQNAKETLRDQHYPGFIVCSASVLKHLRTDRRRKNEIIPIIHFAPPSE